MGTSKKLVLASIVSLMMVLALGVGLFPSYSEKSVGAAGGARADAPSIFTQYFGVKAVDSIEATTAFENLTLVTPVDNARTPALLVPLGSNATTPEAMAQVTYVLEEELVPAVGQNPQELTGFDLTPGATTWSGDDGQTAGPVANPFDAQIDLASFFYAPTAGAFAKSLVVYALANTAAAKDAISITYEERSSNAPDFPGAPKVNFVQVAGNLDADNNGLPDVPFSDVPTGNIWVAESDIATGAGAAARTTLVANLDQDVAKQTGNLVLQPRADITVTVPDLASLVSEGLVGAGEQALVLISVANNLAAAIDEYNDNSAPAARTEWGNTVLGRAPGAKLSDAVYVTILATTGGGTSFTEVTDLEGLSATVSMTGLNLAGAALPQLWSYPLVTTDTAKQAGAILITNVQGTGGDDGLQAWNHVPNTTPAAGATSILASTSLLGNFTLFDSLALTAASPAQVPASNTASPVDVALTGVIPTGTALTLAQANATYTVTATVAGTSLTAAFREGPGGSAITARGEAGGSNTAYIRLTGSLASATGAISITITETATGRSATGSNLITVVPTRTITTQTQSGAAGTPANSTEISLSPDRSGQFTGLTAGQYINGDSVTATYNGTATVIGWKVNGADEPGGTTVNFTVNGNMTIIAVLQTQFTVTVQTRKDGQTDVTPGGVTLAPASTNNTYASGTEVTATYAGPGVFKEWEISAGTIAADGKFTVTQNVTVTGVYTPNIFTITVQRRETNSTTPEAGGVTLTPANSPGQAAGKFEEGAEVTASYTGDGSFLSWEITPGTIGTDGKFTVGADATVTAVYQAVTPAIFTIGTAIRDLVSNEITPNTGITLVPASSPGLNAGQFFEGAAVTANYTGPDNFVRFEISAGSTIDDVSGAFTVTGDATVTGVYQTPIPCREIDVELSIADSGMVSLSPALECYDEGSQVTLTATANPGYEFVSWVFIPASIGDGLNLTVSPITITIPALKQSITVTANFQLTTGAPVLDGQNPLGGPSGEIINDAWLFGGIVSQVNSTNLAAGDTVTFSLTGNTDTTTATIFQRTPVSTPEIIIPVAPASWFATGAASVLANVTVTNANGSDTVQNAFTFKQFGVGEDGVNTTAFVINPAAASSIDVWDGSVLGNIVLDLPTLDTNLSQVFGIARNVQLDVTKNNTASLGTIGFDAALSPAEGGDLVDGAFDFTFHLYGPLTTKQTTPSAGNAAFSQQSDLALFERTVDASGNPVQDSAALLTFPATGTGITAADVRKGLLVWGIELEYDYAAEQTVPVVPQETAYQSELLVNEVMPNLNSSTPNTTPIQMVNQARLFSLNGFTLRQNAIFDAAVANGIRLNTATGTFVANSTSGGDALTIVSALGGLGWVDRVAFVRPGTTTALGTVSTFPAGSANGTTEYELDLVSPASSEAGVVDLLIFLESNTTTPAARLERAFEYKATGGTNLGLLFLLLGLIIAILGLAAGGDSGGGGGGPCFIATAAYGTPLAGQIDSLRVFRDDVLLNSAAGSAFVDAYYTVSPAIADVVAQNPALAALVRIALVPVVAISRLALAMPLMSAALAFILATALVMRRRSRKMAK